MRLHLFDDTIYDNITDLDIDNPDCELPAVYRNEPTHVLLTMAELRARDERIIRAALDFCHWHDHQIVRSARNYHYLAIIAAAKVDR
jgi:hypothetical protein